MLCLEGRVCACVWLLLLCACVWMWWGGCGCGCTRVHVFALKRQICLKKEESRFSDKKKNKQTIVEETLLFGDPARVHKKKADRFLEIMYFCVYVRNSSCCVHPCALCVHSYAFWSRRSKSARNRKNAWKIEKYARKNA